MRDTGSQACALAAHGKEQSRPHSSTSTQPAQEERQWERQAAAGEEQQQAAEERKQKKHRKQRRAEQEAAGERPHKKHRKQHTLQQEAAGGQQPDPEGELPRKERRKQHKQQRPAEEERLRKKRRTKHRQKQVASDPAAAGAGRQQQQRQQQEGQPVEKPIGKKRRKQSRPEQEAAGPGAAAAGAGGQQQQEAAGPPQGALLGFLAQELGGLFGHLSAAAQQFGQTGQLPPSLFPGAAAAEPLVLSVRQAGTGAVAGSLVQQEAEGGHHKKKRRLKGGEAAAGAKEAGVPGPGTTGAAAQEAGQPHGSSKKKKKRKAAALGPAAASQPAQGAAGPEQLQRKKKKKRRMEGTEAAAQGEPGAQAAAPVLAAATGRRLRGGEGEGLLPASLAGEPGLQYFSSVAPSPQRPAAAEGRAGAGGGAGGVEYPHPDIPALLERLADPNYKPPHHWGAEEVAHMVALVEDEEYRRHHLQEGKLKFWSIDKHFKRRQGSSNLKYRYLKNVQQLGARVYGGSRIRSSITLKARAVYALKQLPGMSGTLEQACTKIAEHPVYGAGLNNEPDLFHLDHPVWVESLKKHLSKHPEFVNTGERVKAASGRLQTVWRYCPPEMEEEQAEAQQAPRSKKAVPGLPFLGKHS